MSAPNACQGVRQWQAEEQGKNPGAGGDGVTLREQERKQSSAKWRSYPNNRKVQKETVLLTSPFLGLLPKTRRRDFALRAFASPCVSELCCVRADPPVSSCCRGWGWLGCPSRCLHLPLLALCVMCFSPEMFRSKRANSLQSHGFNSWDCCY